MMLFDSDASVQAFSGVTSLAELVLNAGNAPKEIRHCLELAQAASMDARYLLELCSENQTALQHMPRELERAENALLMARRSVEEVGALLDKYRPLVTGAPARNLPARIVWDAADSEAFSLRIPTLQIQHIAVLHEISHLRTLQLLCPVVHIAGSTEPARAVENRDQRESRIDSDGTEATRKAIWSSSLDSTSTPGVQSQEAARPRTPPRSAAGKQDSPSGAHQSHESVSAGSTWAPLSPRSLHQQPSMLSLFSPSLVSHQPTPPMSTVIVPSPLPDHLSRPTAMLRRPRDRSLSGPLLYSDPNLDPPARPRFSTASTVVSWDELSPGPSSPANSVDNQNHIAQHGLQALFDTRATLLTSSTGPSTQSGRPPISHDTTLWVQGPEGVSPSLYELQGSSGHRERSEPVLAQSLHPPSQRSLYQRLNSEEIDVPLRSSSVQLSDCVSPLGSSVDLSWTRQLSSDDRAAVVNVPHPAGPPIPQSSSSSSPGLTALFGHVTTPAPTVHAQFYELSTHRSVDGLHELEGTEPLPASVATTPASSLPAVLSPSASPTTPIRPEPSPIQEQEGARVYGWQDSLTRKEGNEQARRWLRKSWLFQSNREGLPGS